MIGITIGQAALFSIGLVIAMIGVFLSLNPAKTVLHKKAVAD